MNETSKFCKEPVVTSEDIGDRDAYLWEATACYEFQTATKVCRDRYAAESIALGLVRAKVQEKHEREWVPLTPDTDHDFQEVE